jgi:cation diffusion facilitator family transporter
MPSPRPGFFSHVPGPEARAAGLSLGVGLALLGVKFFAYFVTGSAAIFSDALESIVNVAAAAMAAYALAYAHRPADASHPYGHGKIEFLSAGMEGGMMLVAAVVAGVQAVNALIHPPALQNRRLEQGLLLMGGALLVNGLMGLHLIRTGRRHHSITLEADGKHLLSDAVTSVATIAGVGLVRLTGWHWADPVAALVVAAYITVTGVGLLRRAEGGLMDRQDREDDELLRALLDAHLGAGGAEPRVCSYHKLRHRHQGRYHWVDFHLVVPAGWDVARGHDVASRIEREIEKALGEGDATAHVEPCRGTGCGVCGGRESAEF